MHNVRVAGDYAPEPQARHAVDDASADEVQAPRMRELHHHMQQHVGQLQHKAALCLSSARNHAQSRVS